MKKLFDSFKSIIKEARGVEFQEKQQHIRSMYQVYCRMGDEILEHVAKIRSDIAETILKLDTKPLFEPTLAKCQEAESFVLISSYSEDDFMTYQIDEHSTWVTGRHKHMREVQALSKQLNSDIKTLRHCIGQRADIMKWPKELGKDLAQLDDWLAAVEESIEALLNDSPDKKTKQELSDASLHLADLRKLRSDWMAAAANAAKLAKGIEPSIKSESPFASLLEQVEEQRKNIRETISLKQKSANVLSKIKKRRDDEVSLKRDAPTVSLLRKQIEEAIFKKRLNTHARWRCQQSLELAGKLELTGDAEVDYPRVRKVLTSMKSALANLNYY